MKIIFANVPDSQEDKAVRIVLRILITSLINHILRTGKFPTEEKTVVIVTLYKKGDPSDLNNYRGITLLSTLYKLVTKILNKRMIMICEKGKAISNIQAAGRANRGCLTQITSLLNIIKHSHINKKALYLMSTDIRKAFDAVSHSSFLQSLEIIGYGENFIDLMSNLHSDVTCSVRTPHGLSEKFDIQQGCKQGCALSTLRFILVYDIF